MKLTIRGLSPTDRYVLARDVPAEAVTLVDADEGGDGHADVAIVDAIVALTPAVASAVLAWWAARRSTTTITMTLEVEDRSDPDVTTTAVATLATDDARRAPELADVLHRLRAVAGADGTAD